MRRSHKCTRTNKASDRLEVTLLRKNLDIRNFTKKKKKKKKKNDDDGDGTIPVHIQEFEVQT